MLLSQSERRGKKERESEGRSVYTVQRQRKLHLREEEVWQAPKVLAKFLKVSPYYMPRVTLSCSVLEV